MSSNTLIRVAALYWLSALAGVAHGEADSPFIIVTPTRTAEVENVSSSTLYVIDREFIEQSGVSVTSDLLRAVPGVQIDDLFGNGTQVNLSLRGFSSTANANTLVMVDGRRLNHADTAAPDLHHIFPKDIERIEVISGSAGVLYGDQAVGGVINIITRKAARTGNEITLKSGSFGYRGAQFSSVQQIQGERSSMAYRLAGERFQADHYRNHNRQSNGNLQGYFEYTRDRHQLYFDFQRIDDELQLPGALLENEFKADPRQTNRGFANDYVNEDTTVTTLGYARDIDSKRFTIDLSQRTTDSDVLQSFRDSPSPAAGFIAREQLSLNPRLSGTINPNGLSTPWVVGVDVEDVKFDLRLPNAFGETRASNSQRGDSLYAQLRPALGESMRLTLGLRRSRVDKDIRDGFTFANGLNLKKAETVTELGLSVQATQRLKWSLRVEENFRFAKIDELALAAPGKVLETQTGISYEAGMHWAHGAQSLNLSLYRLDLENEIFFDPTVGVFGANVNLAKTRRDGFSLDAGSQVSDALRVGAQIAYVDARFASGVFDGKRISGVADTLVGLRLDYRFSTGLSGWLEARRKSDFLAQGDNANAFPRIDGVTTVNLGVNYLTGPWSFMARINNLTDEDYAEFVTNNGFGAAYQPSPERNFLVSAGYRFE